MSAWTAVSHRDALVDGEPERLQLETGDQLLLIRCGTEIFAIEDRCSHDGGELCSGRIEGEEIVCPRHDARFSLRDGSVCAPPAWEPIRSYPLRVLDCGTVEIKVPDES